MKLAQEVLLSEKEREEVEVLREAGYLDGSLQLTEKAHNVLVRLFLFAEYKDDLIARAKKIVAEKRENE